MEHKVLGRSLMKISRSQIFFNPLKHHLRFTCLALKKITDASSEAGGQLLDEIKSINANFVDVYTGQFSPAEIEEAIADGLRNLGIYTYSDFMQFLGEKRFQLLTLKDQSVWVLRMSEYKSAFVHIHPSRTLPWNVRIHGNAWRTVIGLLIIHPEFIKEVPSLQNINTFRQQYLGLSPVKGEENIKRIMRVYNLVQQNLAN